VDENTERDGTQSADPAAARISVIAYKERKKTLH
jgi:hypothetical protein